MAKEIVVLMSTYNGERYLKEQIDSILTQEDCDVKLFVRDDMSTDNTINILSQYKSKGLLDWYRDGNNLGPAKSFLSLLKKAPNADYYAFADQDDVWQKDKLRRGIDRIGDSDKAIVYYANAELVDENLKSLGCKVYKTRQPQSAIKGLCSCNALGCTMIFNSKVRETVNLGGIPDNLIMHDNYVCGVCIASGGRIIYDDYIAVFYRQHGNNVVGATGNLTFIEWMINKFEFLRTGNKVSISTQCGEILKRIKCDDSEKKLVEEIANYKIKMKYRLHIAGKLVWTVMKKEASKHELIVAAGILLGNK